VSVKTNYWLIKKRKRKKKEKNRGVMNKKIKNIPLKELNNMKKKREY